MEYAEQISKGLQIILQYNTSPDIFSNHSVNEIIVDGIVKDAMEEEDYNKLKSLEWTYEKGMWFHNIHGDLGKI